MASESGQEKRERVGNAEAMREALVALSAWVKIVKANPKDKTASECAEFVEVAVKAALSAPARNCDKFDNAQTAFQHFCVAHTAPNYPKTPKWMRDFLTWLLAPAEKGGAE